MHQHDAQREADPAEPVRIRTLRREYRVFAPDAEARRVLSFIETTPTLTGLELEPVDLPVERVDGFLKAQLPYGPLVEGSSTHLLSMLHGLVNWDVGQSHGDLPLIHGATLRIGGRRLLLVGDKGAGKTTLSLYLLARGHGFEGDEHVVVLPDAVIARPRTLRVKAGSFALIPDLPPALQQAPAIPFWDGSLLYSIDPRSLGQDWTIGPGRLDAIVLIDSDFGAHSYATRLTVEEGFQAIVARTLFPKRAVAMEIARIRVLVATTPSYSLRLGDLQGAEWHLKKLLGLDEHNG